MVVLNVKNLLIVVFFSVLCYTFSDKAIYDTEERMGFTTGKILELTCGVGNFFGFLPESIVGRNLYCIGLDSITI